MEELAKTLASLGVFFLYSPPVPRFILSHCGNNRIWTVMELMCLFRVGCYALLYTAVQGGARVAIGECLDLCWHCVDMTKSASLGCGESAD